MHVQLKDHLGRPQLGFYCGLFSSDYLVGAGCDEVRGLCGDRTFDISPAIAHIFVVAEWDYEWLSLEDLPPELPTEIPQACTMALSGTIVIEML